jgi:hypothetical protein
MDYSCRRSSNFAETKTGFIIFMNGSLGLDGDSDGTRTETSNGCKVFVGLSSFLLALLPPMCTRSASGLQFARAGLASLSLRRFHHGREESSVSARCGSQVLVLAYVRLYM